MKTAKDIEGVLDKASIQTNPKVSQAVLDELVGVYGRSTKTPPLAERPGIGRRIMTSKMTKLAVAAAIGVAALIGLSHMTGPAVAWGEVVGRVEKATAFMFSLKLIVTNDQEQTVPTQVQTQWTIYVSEEHGFRMDMAAQDGGSPGTVISWYVPPQQDKITMVIPTAKWWVEMPYSEEYAKQAQDKDKDPVEYIRRFMAKGYKEIGRKTIDGIDVEGIEVQDPPTEGEPMEQSVGRMWVDVRSQMPIRIEIEGLAKTKPVQCIMDFRWSQAIDPAVFVPDIQPDYTHAN